MMSAATPSPPHGDPQTSGLFQRSWVRWVLLFAAWTFPAVLIAGLIHVRMMQIGETSSFWTWLLGKQLAWWIWALLTPLIVRLGRRFRLDDRWLRNGLIHAGFAIVLASVQTALAVFISMAVHGETLTLQTWACQVIPYVMYQGPWEFLVYWGVLAISYAFEYHGRLRDRELAGSRLETEVARGRLEALQRQLQPHFLFNTLNSISVLMQKGETEAANRMLGGLSDLLRYVLARGDRPEVPLSEELDFVRRYVEIEKTRFGDRLQVDIDIPAEVLPALLPSFVLQTLVENAIRHGVAPKPGAGHVVVAAVGDGGRLRLSVRDDGVGLRDVAPGASIDGIGMQNTRRRLEHLYGSDHRLALHGAGAGGTIAELDIPLRFVATPGETAS